MNSSKAKDVQISDFTQSLEISIDRGDVELRPGRLPLARIDVTTKHGQIDLAIPEQAKFDLRATASRGDVTNDYGDTLRVESSGSRGHMLLGTVGAGPAIVLTSSRGGITIRKGDVFTPAPPPSPAPPATPSKPVVRVE